MSFEDIWGERDREGGPDDSIEFDFSYDPNIDPESDDEWSHTPF